jgi:predicted phosphodiesterase
VAVAAGLGLAGCAGAAYRPVAPPVLDGCAAPATWTARPGRFGVVADSQFNTLHSSYRTIYRKRPIDVLVDVAIRPPALDLTSHYLLRAILDKQVRAGAEVIFYLGDGANNGCQDELVGRREVDGIDGIFTVLRQARARYGVPIFYVLGNHDYLGAGNTSALMSTRHALCNTSRAGRNAALSKFEVMRVVHEFNAESAAAADGWRYTDNWDAEGLERACNGGERRAPRNQHMRPGCWLAGRVAHRRGRAEYLLVDSNDYADAPASMFFAGRRGAVSFRRWGEAPAQVEWLRGAADAGAEVRVILSHYNLDTINASDGAGVAHARLSRLALPRRTLWLSGHTHNPTIQRLAHALKPGVRAGAVELPEVNVGSSTDWPAYALVAEAGVDPARRTAELFAQTQVFAISPERCEATLAALDEVTAGSKFFPFQRHTRGLGLFGLDFLVDWTLARKEYRTRRWTRADDQHVRDNIRTWLDEHAPATTDDRCGWPGAARLTAGACIGLYASLQEGVKHGWAPVGCERCRPTGPRRPRTIAPDEERRPVGAEGARAGK